MATELVANNFATQLTVGCAPGDISLQVAAAAPAALQGGQFRVLIDQEYMIVTAGQSGTTWSVTRAAEGTTAGAHGVGSWVTHTFTAGGMAGLAANIGAIPGPAGLTGPPGVGANWRGIWSSGTTYALADGVQGSDGLFYISNVAGNLNHDPVGDRSVHWNGPLSGSTGTPLSQYGIKVDGRRLSGLSVSGTALTASGAVFLASDVGKTILLENASGDGVAGQAVIQTYNSSTSLTLATSITTTSGTTGTLGTDDTAAWQAVINAAYASASGVVAIYSGNGISLIAGAQQSGTVTSTNPGAGGAVYSYSGQLLLPAVAQANNSLRMFEIRGVIPPPMVTVMGFGGEYECGLILQGNGSGFIFDVIPDPQGFVYGKGSFSWVSFNLRRVTVRQPFHSTGTVGAINAVSCACFSTDECSIDTTTTNDNHPIPTSSGTATQDGCAVVLPGDNNWGIAVMKGPSQVIGYPKGIGPSEHAQLNVWIESCGAPLAPGSLNRSAGIHGADFQRVEVANCRTYIEPVNSCPVAGKLQIETPTDCLINDPNSWISGDLMVGGILGSNRLFVRAVSANLALRSTHNAVAGNPGIPVVDTLKWAGAPATPPIGVADGSNHTYYNPGPAFYLDGNGAYPVTGNGGALLFIQNGPAWPSRKVSVTFKSSPNANKAYGGLITRSTLNSPFQVILSNNFNAGVTIYESGSNTQVAHAAYTIVPNTEYRIDFITQTSTKNPALVVATVLVNNVRVLSYTFTVGDVATYLPGGYDGLSCAQNGATDDGNSRFYNLSVTPVADLDYVVAGTVTMAAGASNILNSNITSAAVIRVFRQSAGGTLGDLSVALTPGTGFAINSNSATDTSSVYYEVLQY